MKAFRQIIDMHGYWPAPVSISHIGPGDRGPGGFLIIGYIDNMGAKKTVVSSENLTPISFKYYMERYRVPVGLTVRYAHTF